MRLLVPVLGVAVLAACSDTLPVEYAAAPDPRFSAAGATVAGRYVVQVSNAMTADEFTRVTTSLGGTVVAHHSRAGFAVVDGLSASAAASLGSRRGVQAVEPDLVAQVVDLPVASVVDVSEQGDVGATSQANPATAFFFPRQWHHRAIGAQSAWAAGALGSPSVTVAILDSGIDETYVDLAGLVDVTRSESFVPTGSTRCLDPSDDQLINGRPASATCPALPAFFPGRARWSDLNGHGTFTAGLVSSKAIAAAGVTSKVTLIAVKVLNARGNGAFSSILQGVAHATDKGADVINMSLGAVFPRHGGYIGFLNGITQYARSRGVTVVVAAGNDGIDLDHSGGAYAAFCSSGMVICVSATGPTKATRLDGVPSVNGPLFLPSVDESAIYTNFGTSSVDVAAPGGNWAEDAKGTITSAVFVWSGCSRTKLDYIVPTVPEGSPPETLPDPPFYRKNVCTTGTFGTGGVGTSAAAPHVAGLAALLVERYGRNPGEIRTLLQETADDLGKLGADPQYGKGRINVPRALGL